MLGGEKKPGTIRQNGQTPYTSFDAKAGVKRIIPKSETPGALMVWIIAAGF